MAPSGSHPAVGGPGAPPVASSAGPSPARRLISTAEGSSSAPFTPLDWGLVVLSAGVWGASYLLIAESLEAFAPGVVVTIRIIFGLATLFAVRRARTTRVARGDWPRVALLGVLWFAVPQTMFSVAEQWVPSAVAGMLNGALPLFAAAISALLLRRAPGPSQLKGLAVGFVGVVLISVPSLQGGSRLVLGTVLVFVALVSYAISGNVVVPLQQRYGAIGVIARAQVVALVASIPYTVVGLGESHWSWHAFGAVVVLGALGTGVAFVAAGTLMGRVGATRGSIIAYLIPVVALVLGVILRDETVEPIAIAGLALVLAGAWLTSRAGR
jgi:drug/metabolite transporter (DMT)-like permease